MDQGGRGSYDKATEKAETGHYARGGMCFSSVLLFSQQVFHISGTDHSRFIHDLDLSGKNICMICKIYTVQQAESYSTAVRSTHFRGR